MRLALALTLMGVVFLSTFACLRALDGEAPKVEDFETSDEPKLWAIPAPRAANGECEAVTADDLRALEDELGEMHSFRFGRLVILSFPKAENLALVASTKADCERVQNLLYGNEL